VNDEIRVISISGDLISHPPKIVLFAAQRRKPGVLSQQKVLKSIVGTFQHLLVMGFALG
jgi:hypothetical protein